MGYSLYLCCKTNFHLSGRLPPTHLYFILQKYDQDWSGKIKGHLLVGLPDTAYEGPGWQIPSKPPEFTTSLTALQCEPKADLSRSYTCTNDNDKRNMILLYHPLPKIKTWTCCLDLSKAHRGRWARLEGRLSWGWAGCSLLWGHVRLQALCPEEAFSAVLGVMKKYGCELNPPRNDEMT